MMKILKKQDGMVFIAALVALFFLGTLGVTMANLTASNLAGSEDDSSSSQALYVAQGGMQYIIQNQFNGDSNFSDNISPTGDPFGVNGIALSPGQFWVQYLNQQASSLTVRVTARVGDAVRVVQQNVALLGNGFQYVTVAGGNLNMNTSSGSIFGDVGISGQINVSDDVVVQGNLISDPTIVVPTIDFDTYEDMTTSTHEGNKTFNSNYAGDLHVTGNCTINANVTITGILYCDGNININGSNVIVNGTMVSGGHFNGDNQSGLQILAQPLSPDVHMPAILSQGEISLKNTDGIVTSGVMWSGGNIDMTNADNGRYTGSFIVEGNIIFNTALNLSLTFDADLLVGVPGLSSLNGGQQGSLSLSGYQTY